MIRDDRRTLAMETYARRSYNYYNRMVDKQGLPYFNIFWHEPSEAAHDWPDFGDVMSRQIQGVIMGRCMTGEEAAIEKVWMQNCLSLLGQDGLLYRPQTSYSQCKADIGDQSLTLYALVTAYAASKDDSMRQRVLTMTDTIIRKFHAVDPEDRFVEEFGGFIIKSLMACGRVLGYRPAIDMAGEIVHRVMDQRLFTPDNTFRHGGHMHGTLRCAYGIADYALYAGDAILYSRMDAVYRYVRDCTATRFGFLPEQVGRADDIVLCETCAVLDYLALAVTLANHGHPEYWGDVERIVRNQLIENQVKDASWLIGDDNRGDSEQFTWRELSERVEGCYAGWSTPTHILGCRETMVWWGGPELKGKTRAFQQCCGGSGTHALYIAWKNASRFEKGTLSVHLYIDKLLPQAEIRSYQPYRGLMTIRVLETCKVRVRIPDFIPEGALAAVCDGQTREYTVWGNYAELGEVQAGAMVEISYPMVEFVTQETIGNPAGRKYHYKVTWKGDTVMKMEPVGNEFATGYSKMENQYVEVFYGEEGPGRLYQRDHMLGEGDVALTELHMDNGALDHWYFPSR